MENFKEVSEKIIFQTVFKWRCMYCSPHSHYPLWKSYLQLIVPKVRKRVNKNCLYTNICFIISGFELCLNVILSNLTIKIKNP